MCNCATIGYPCICFKYEGNMLFLSTCNDLQKKINIDSFMHVLITIVHPESSNGNVLTSWYSIWQLYNWLYTAVNCKSY